MNLDQAKVPAKDLVRYAQQKAHVLYRKAEQARPLTSADAMELSEALFLTARTLEVLLDRLAPDLAVPNVAYTPDPHRRGPEGEAKPPRDN